VRVKQSAVATSILSIVALVVQFSLSGPALAAAGDLDQTFGHDGTITYSAQALDGIPPIDGMATTPDGRIVAVGSTYNPHRNEQVSIIARFTAHGGPDSTFAHDGSLRRNSFAIGAVAVQADRRIVVASLSYVQRFMPHGALDTSFATDGTFFLPPTKLGQASILPLSVDVLGNGEIQVSGRRQTNGALRAVFLRLLPDGSPDPSFGTDGVRRSHFFQPTAVDVLPSGSFEVLGWTPHSPFTQELVRYRRGGALDASFGNGGVVPVSGVEAIAFDAQGGVIVAGQHYGGRSQFALRRYNPDGTPDLSFGESGDSPLVHGVVTELAVDSEGRIVAAGDVPDGRWVVSRYAASGSLDPSFSDDGHTTVLFPRPVEGATLALEPNGEIVVGGVMFTPKHGKRFALARLLA
jgi:uncharacterized delta-60 repeat protein